MNPSPTQPDFDVADAVTRYWNARAPHFDAVASHVKFEAAWRTVLAAALGNGPPRDVLDVGTGTGACALIAADLGHRVTAIDGSEGMLQIARRQAAERRVTIRFEQMLLDDPALADPSFDIAIMRNVLWTLERPQAALVIVRRLLRPDGRIVVADGLWSAAPEGRSQYPCDLVERLPLHPGLTVEQARGLLGAAGFCNFQAWHHLFKQSPYPPGQPFFVLSGLCDELGAIASY